MHQAKPCQIYLLYSQKDQPLATQVSSYLNEFKLKEIIYQFTEVVIEELAVSGIEQAQIKKSRDIFFIVATPSFLKSDFAHSSFLQDLITRHHLKRNQLIPIFFYAEEAGSNKLQKLNRLQSNQNTLLFHSQSALHQQLIPIFQELAPRVLDWRRYNQELDEAWKMARSIDDYDTYLAFQNIHQHSVYALETKKILEELVEEKLWNEAVSFDQMKYYYEYLANAPLKKYEEACIKKIQEIENKQESAQVDALKNKNIALTLDFKARFDQKAYSPDIDQHLYQLFDQPTADNPDLHTETYFLQHKAFQNCSPEEALSLNLSLTYNQQIKARVKRVLGNLQSFRSIYSFGIVACGLIFLGLFFYYTLAIFHLGKMNMALFLGYIVLVFVAYRCYDGLLQATKCIEKHQSLYDQVCKDYIYLQIAAVSQDQEQIRRIQFNLANTNFNLLPYEKASIISFIGMAEALEVEQVAQQYLTTKGR